MEGWSWDGVVARYAWHEYHHVPLFLPCMHYENTYGFLPALQHFSIHWYDKTCITLRCCNAGQRQLSGVRDHLITTVITSPRLPLAVTIHEDATLT